MCARIFSIFLIAIVAATAAHAATTAPVPTGFPVAPMADVAQQVALEHSALALMGPWKFHLGDDMAWAQPGFDDSGWENYTLQAQGLSGAVPAWFHHAGGDPGWAGHGHRGVWGYGWYGIRVNLANGIGESSTVFSGSVGLRPMLMRGNTVAMSLTEYRETPQIFRSAIPLRRASDKRVTGEHPGARTPSLRRSV